LSISRSQLVTTLVGATMSALKGLRLPSTFASSPSPRGGARASARSCRAPCRRRDAAGADLVEEPEPVEALLLVRAERALRLRGFFAPLISSMSLSFEELLRLVGDARAPDLLEQLLDAPACESGSLPPCPPPVARISACAGAPRGPSGRRAARTSRRPGARSAAPPRGSAPSSSCVTATPRSRTLRRSDSQSTPLETRALAPRASSRTFTSTRSSGTKRSHSSGSWPMPSVQNWIASSPRRRSRCRLRRARARGRAASRPRLAARRCRSGCTARAGPAGAPAPAASR
jgi:hypothetical protein